MNLIFPKEFDRIYADLGWVDYYKIVDIADSEIKLIVYTKVPINSADDRFDILLERHAELGEKLHKDINWSVENSSSTFNSIMNKFIGR